MLRAAAQEKMLEAKEASAKLVRATRAKKKLQPRRCEAEEAESDELQLKRLAGLTGSCQTKQPMWGKIGPSEKESLATTRDDVDRDS